MPKETPKVYKAGQKVNNPYRIPGLFGVMPDKVTRAPEREEAQGLAAFLNRPAHQGLNFLGDIATLGAGNQSDSYGTGWGDQIFGRVSPGYYKGVNSQVPVGVNDNRWTGGWGGQDMSLVNGGGAGAKGIWDYKYEKPYYDSPGVARGGSGGAGDTDSGQGWTPLGLQDALDQVRAMMKADGYDDGSVSYDPLRAAARSQWSDADARTLAMYQQLQSAIGADAGTLNNTYDEAVANTNEATEFANQQNLQSAQGMNSMQSQQAQALGIQEAVGNDIQAGNYAARDALDRTADTTARGQITSNLMNSNRASALDYNTDLVGAAGLQGTMVRNQRANELSKLLAQYDVSEQEANRSAAQNRQQQEFSLAQFLMGTNRSDRDSENSLQRGMTQDANQSDQFWAQFYADQAGDQGGWTPASAREQALKDYGWTEEDMRDQNNRDLVLKRQMQYLSP